MKTKNFLLTGALLIMALFSVNGVMAQSATSYVNEGSTTVNIKLNGIQAIVVNGAAVNLTYNTIEDYNNGVDKNMSDHLTVYSVGAFVVKVSSDGIFETTSGEKLSTGTVTITAEKQESSPGDLETVVITTGTAITKQPLITSSEGGFGQNYSVKYKHEFTDKNGALTNPDDTYSATVTYEIAAS